MTRMFGRDLKIVDGAATETGCPPSQASSATGTTASRSAAVRSRIEAPGPDTRGAVGLPLLGELLPSDAAYAEVFGDLPEPLFPKSPHPWPVPCPSGCASSRQLGGARRALAQLDIDRPPVQRRWLGFDGVHITLEPGGTFTVNVRLPDAGGFLCENSVVEGRWVPRGGSWRLR